MIRYEALTEKQIENIHNILEKANGTMFQNFKEDFPDFKLGISNEESRINISHALMRNDIPINYIKKWASELFLNQANTIFMYQLDNCNKYKTLGTHPTLLKKTKNILDVDKNITDIQLVSIDTTISNQILFSFVMPCEVEKKNKFGISEFQKDLYFAYVWLDFKKNALVFSIPQYPNHILINNKIIKKNQYEQIVNEIFTFFKESNLSFSFGNLEWIIDSLNQITKEYFDHNNPVIYDTIVGLQEREELDKIITGLTKLDSNLNNDFSKRRIKKSLMEIIETELIRNLGPIRKQVPFQIFLQEVTKGGTDFKASNKKLPFDSDESREIIKKMVEHGEINALGLSYNFEERDYKYKIYFENDYFALRRLTTGQTKKEVVEDVLSTLIEYKQRVQSKPTSSSVRQTKQ
ncbi:hypothetical protein [Lysinibacillus capsici]|uniref:hypothetical protein n=1 Tax=Lysinibacillus capsici TaxID=2115968 RepID=UPI002E2065F4|nr:hypothetical protein [Lysinibacillus capsici]